MTIMEYSLDKCISSLAHKFIKWPNNFFTESDAHSFLYYYFFRSGPKVLKLFYPTKDGNKTVLIHREYPTSFRFFKESMELDDKGGRGHYDLVVLNPDFLETHDIKHVMAKDFKYCCTNEPFHLKAALEFKLITSPLSANLKEEIKRDIKKLDFSLSLQQTENAYMIIFNRCREEKQFAGELKKFSQNYPLIKIIYVETQLKSDPHYYCLYINKWTEMLKFNNIEVYPAGRVGIET